MDNIFSEFLSGNQLLPDAASPSPSGTASTHQHGKQPVSEHSRHVSRPNCFSRPFSEHPPPSSFASYLGAILDHVTTYLRWPRGGRGDGLEVEPMSRNPEGRGSIPRLGSLRSSLISIEHAELLRSTPSLVLCCAWLVTMALHVHCGLGQLSPLPTSGDDK